MYCWTPARIKHYSKCIIYRISKNFKTVNKKIKEAIDKVEEAKKVDPHFTIESQNNNQKIVYWIVEDSILLKLMHIMPLKGQQRLTPIPQEKIKDVNMVFQHYYNSKKN